MRCRPMVVLPLPADPWIAIRPDDGWVISSNWRGSISAAIAGRWRSGRRAPRVVEAQLAARRGAARRRQRRRCAPRRAGRRPPRCRRARSAAAPARVATSRQLPGAQIARERPLRGRDPAQIGVDDRDRAAREHLALDQLVAQPLLVGVAFLVAVEEARHGRVAPVDDLHAAARLDEAARADQDVAALAALLQAQVAEVGRLAIDGRRVALAALLRQRLDPVHLLQDRSLVLGLGLGQRVAQLDQRAGVVDLDARSCAGAPRVQLAQHDVEELLLLADDRRRRFVGRRRRLPPTGSPAPEVSDVGCCTRPVSIVAPAVAVTLPRVDTGNTGCREGLEAARSAAGTARHGGDGREVAGDCLRRAAFASARRHNTGHAAYR